MEHDHGGFDDHFLSKWVTCRFHVNLPGLTPFPEIFQLAPEEQVGINQLFFLDAPKCDLFLCQKGVPLKRLLEHEPC